MKRAGNAPAAALQAVEMRDAHRNDVESWQRTCSEIGTSSGSARVWDRVLCGGVLYCSERAKAVKYAESGEVVWVADVNFVRGKRCVYRGCGKVSRRRHGQ